MTRDEIIRMAREAGFVGMDADHGALRRFAAPQPPKLSDERILCHLDAILKASGSGLKNYSMHKTIEDMKQAVRAIEREILGENNDSN